MISPASDGALGGTAAPMRNPLSLVHSAASAFRLSYLRDGIVGERSRVLREGFEVKAWREGEAWERDLSSDAGIDLDSDDSA